MKGKKQQMFSCDPFLLSDHLFIPLEKRLGKLCSFQFGLLSGNIFHSFYSRLTPWKTSISECRCRREKPPYLNVEVVTKRVLRYGAQFTTWSNEGSFDYLKTHVTSIQVIIKWSRKQYNWCCGVFCKNWTFDSKNDRRLRILLLFNF